MGSIKDIDREIAKINFILGGKQEELNKISKKLQLNEREKIYLGRETEMVAIVKSLINRVKNEMHIALGKVPPSSAELEETVLGAILTEKSEAAIKKVITFLKPEHFHTEANKLIYAAMVELDNTGVPVDMPMVVTQLRIAGHIEIVGGSYRIAEITSRVGTAGNVEYYARVLVEYAMKRQMIEVGSELINCGYDDTKDAFVLLDYGIDHLNEIKAWIKK